MKVSPFARACSLMAVAAVAMALGGCAADRIAAIQTAPEAAPAASAPAASAPAALAVEPTSGVSVVPDMSGRIVEEAAAELRRIGFNVALYDEEGWVGSIGSPNFRTVASQFPTGGREWPIGATVKLGVAVPSGMVSVPDVEGLLTSEAEARLNAASLRAEEAPVHGPIDTDQAGFMRAYRQDPRPGTVVKKGSTVTYRFWWESQ